MSVNIKKNGALIKLAGLYDSINLRLSQLLDTDISSLEDGQILAYNNETEKWENQEAPAGVEVVDDLATQSATSALSANQGYVLNNALAGKANTADILPTLITNPANKQILSYDSSSSKWINTANENTVLLGTVDPAVNLGKEGDIYIKLSSSSYGSSYRIYTTGTGGETANITVQTIINGAVTNSDTIFFRQPNRTYPDFTTTYKNSNWTVTITSNNVYGRAQGSTISWPYYQTNDVTLTINPPSVYGIFVKSRGIWIQIGKSPVENFAELKDINFSNLQDGQLAVYNNTTSKWENQTPNFNDLFIITMTSIIDPQTEEEVYSVDKTPSEVVAAYNSNKIIQIAFNNFYMPLSSSSITAEGTSFMFSISIPGDSDGLEAGLLLLESTINENVWSDISLQSLIFKSDRSFMPQIYLSPTTNEYYCAEDFQEFEDAYNLLSSLQELSHMGVKYDSQVYRFEKHDEPTHTFYFTSTLTDSNTITTKTFVMVPNITTSEWTSITLEEISINSSANIFTIAISSDEQTGELDCDKLPSEVAEAYSNGAIIQVSIEMDGSPAIVPLITYDSPSNTYLFGFSAANQSSYASISGITIGLVKDESNDSWAEITPILKVVGTPLIAVISKDGNIYSCDKDPFDFEQALEDNCGVILQYIDEHDVKFNYTLIGYKDTYIFASVIPTDTTNATIQMFRLDPPAYGNVGWDSITLLEYNLGSSEFSLEQTATTSTSANTVYTFTDARITTNNVVDVYTNIFGISPSNIVLANGSCTVTFPAQASAQSMTCKIYVK